MSITFSVAWDPTVPGDSDLPDVNVSNVNGIELIRALGLVGLDDYFGEVQASALIAACDQLMATPDEGIAPSQGPGLLYGVPVANMLDCGRRPGYFQDRAADLLEVALVAQRLGRTVVWS